MKKQLYKKRKHSIIIYVLHGDVIGFDSNLEAQIASSGWLLWPLKKSKIKINADNQLAYAA